MAVGVNLKLQTAVFRLVNRATVDFRMLLRYGFTVPCVGLDFLACFGDGILDNFHDILGILWVYFGIQQIIAGQLHFNSIILPKYLFI